MQTRPTNGSRITFTSVDGRKRRTGWVAEVRDHEARVMDVLMPLEKVGWSWSEWTNWTAESCVSEPKVDLMRALKASLDAVGARADVPTGEQVDNGK